MSDMGFADTEAARTSAAQLGRRHADSSMTKFRASSAVVDRQGQVEVLGLRFWSPELYKYVGWEVLIEVTDDDGFADVWSKGRTHRLCTVGCLGRADFEDMESARETARKLRDERASIVRGQIAEVLDIIDKRVERALERAEARNAAARHGRVGNIVRFISRAWKLRVENGEVRRDETAQNVDLDLDLIEAALKRGSGSVGHGNESPNVQSGAEPKPPVHAAHRLCEGAK